MSFKKNFILLAMSLLTLVSFAQVPKKILLEHFTNTNCSVCASRNPGLYDNIKKHPQIMHLAFHPSSPYSACKLDKVNPAANDARTKYYGVYGSTPKIAINGVNVSPSTNYADTSIFSSYYGLTSPISIKMQPSITTSKDSFTLKITIKNVQTKTLSNNYIFVGIFEDTVFYKSPNGEATHKDVFRDALSKIGIGDKITLPSKIGDSVFVKYGFKYDKTSNWDFKRLYFAVIVEDSTNRNVIQSERTFPGQNTPLTAIEVLETKSSSTYSIYPNPFNNVINIKDLDNNIKATTQYQILDLSGRTVLNNSFSRSTQLNLENLASGTYILKLSSKDKVYTTKVQKRD